MSLNEKLKAKRWYIAFVLVVLGLIIFRKDVDPYAFLGLIAFIVLVLIVVIPIHLWRNSQLGKK